MWQHCIRRINVLIEPRQLLKFPCMFSGKCIISMFVRYDSQPTVQLVESVQKASQVVRISLWAWCMLGQACVLC